MQSFCKSERLCNKTLFEELLKSDFTFVKYPYRIIAKISSVPGDFPVRMAISVSKKRFKRAVKRNYIKRLTREAFRLNKTPFYSSLPQGKTIDLLFIYLDTNLPSFAKTEKAVKNSFIKIPSIFHSNIE